MNEQPDSAPHRPTPGAPPISLSISAETRFLVVARLATGAVAAMAGLDVDLADDAKLVVNEAALALIEHGSGNPVRILLTPLDGSTAVGVDIIATTETQRFDPDHEDFQLCWSVLAGLSSRCSLSFENGLVTITASVCDVTP